MSHIIPCSQPLCCPLHGTDHAASHVIQWRTARMAAPAFWYVCANSKDTLLAEMDSVEKVRAL